MHLDVVDQDPGAVEGSDRRGGQAVLVADRGAQPPAVVAEVGLPSSSGRSASTASGRGALRVTSRRAEPVSDLSC